MMTMTMTFHIISINMTITGTMGTTMLGNDDNGNACGHVAWQAYAPEADTRYVSIQLLEIGGDHLDLLMLPDQVLHCHHHGHAHAPHHRHHYHHSRRYCPHRRCLPLLHSLVTTTTNNHAADVARW